MNDSPMDADLTRLADGTLPDAKAAALRARVQRDPDLRVRLREQQRGVALVHASEEVAAPASLHAAIHAQTSQRSSGVRGRARWRPRLLAPLTATMVATAVVVVVLVSGGSGSLTVTEIARATALASPTHGAPALERGNVDLLSLTVGSVHFPAYERQTDSRATGARTDQLHGRQVQTVFYTIGGRQVGYSIISGSALPVPRGSLHTVQGVRYVAATTGRARLITWRRAGHTCIIAGRHIIPRTLLSLAAATQAT